MDSMKLELNRKYSTEQLSSTELSVEAIEANPCLLAKIASNLGAESVRSIVSRSFITLSYTFMSCKGVFGRQVDNTIVSIEGDENSMYDIKRIAHQYLTRDIRCFVVICSQVCSNFILHIAKTLGFGVGIYHWITITPLVLKYDVNYPKNLLSLTFT